MHVDTHFRERCHALRRGVGKVAGEAGHGQKILRIRRRDMEGAQPSIGHAGDVELVIANRADEVIE